MSMTRIKMLVVVATGEFREGGYYEPVRPRSGGTDNEPIFDPAFAVVEIPGDQFPDFRTERYDASAESKVRAATADEIAAYDLAQPKWISSGELIRRMTDAEWFFLWQGASQNAAACRLIALLLSAGNTDVHGAEWQQGVAFFVPAGVQAQVWPDTATANARVAEITA